jgi:antitoxin component YwqK of YwqJK toxin-antitoxin module
MKRVITLAVCVLLSLSLNAQTTEVIVKDSSGNVIEKGFLNENNEKESIWVAYNDKGVIVSVMEYKNGKKDGTWYMYNDKGHVVFKILYVDGKKRRGRQWDNKGHLIDSRTWDSEEVLVAEYKRYYR